MPIPPTISSEERMEVIAAVGKLHDYALRALLHDLQPAYYRMSEYRAQREYKHDMPRLRIINTINSLLNWRRLPK